jgi:glycosyltransferase involved in cell wall biosynthesis
MVKQRRESTIRTEPAAFPLTRYHRASLGFKNSGSPAQTALVQEKPLKGITCHRPIRALHVLDLAIGGAQIIFLNTLQALDPRRCRTIVACLGIPGTLMAEVAKLAPVHNRTFGSNDVGALLFLLRLMRAEQVDVVHTYLYSRSSVYGRLAAIMARVPVLVAAEMGRSGQYPWKRWKAERLLTRFTDHFVTLSQATQVDLIRQQVLPSKVTVIYPGVDLTRFDVRETSPIIRCELGLPDWAAVIGVVARLDPIKGHTDLITAFPKILQAVPTARLVFIGDGPAASDLRHQVHEVGLAEHVHFLGSRRDIPRLLRAFDVFVLPSHQEGLGLAIIEAMAAGLPVVATRVGGIPEVVVEEETGLLVEPRNPPGLAEAIIHLLTNAHTRRQMSSKGRQRVEAYFTAQRTAANLTALYYRLLQAKGVF